MTDRIKMKRITVQRVEGPYVDPYWPVEQTRTFTDWDVCRSALLKLCNTLDPKIGGYDKCDFVVTFEDGETYTGRFDAAHPGSSSHEQPDLQRRIRQFVGMMALQYRPHWHTDLDWARWVKSQQARPGDIERAKAFLDKYEVGQ